MPFSVLSHFSEVFGTFSSKLSKQMKFRRSTANLPMKVLLTKLNFDFSMAWSNFGGQTPLGLKNEFHFETSRLFYLIIYTNNCEDDNYLLTFEFFNPPYD